MSAIDGKIECDRCAKDLGAGSLYDCVVVSRINFQTGGVENLHLCIDKKVTEDGTVEEVAGCGQEVIDPELTARRKRLKAEERARKAAERDAAAAGSDEPGSGGSSGGDSGKPRRKSSRGKGDGTTRAKKNKG
jgi:hypothetical protein